MKKNVTIVFYLCLFAMIIPLPNSFPGFFDDLREAGDYLFFGKNKIQKWNEENKGKFSINKATLGRESNSACTVALEFTNQTKEYIDSIVVNIKLYNKTTKDLIVQEKATILIAAVPTATKKINDSVWSHDLAEAMQQLEGNWEWNYDLIGIVPKGMDGAWFD